jgi:hypothetical protein
MIRRSMRALSLLAFAAALAFGGVAAFDTPADAQVTVKCWKEYCVYDPDTKKTYCAKEEIPCPEQET